MRDPAVAADGHSTVQMLGSCGEATVDETACLASLPAELLGAVLPAAGLVSLASSCSAMRDSMAPFVNGWLERGLDALFRKACGHETAGANLYGARERWSAFVAARRSLALAKCSLRLEEIRLLLHAHRLAPAAGLRHLSLRNNGLGDDATAQLARAIGSGALRWTETLFLCGNHITDLGLRSLVEAVQEGGGGAAAHGGAAAPAPSSTSAPASPARRLAGCVSSRSARTASATLASEGSSTGCSALCPCCCLDCQSSGSARTASATRGLRVWSRPCRRACAHTRR